MTPRQLSALNAFYDLFPVNAVRIADEGVALALDRLVAQVDALPPRKKSKPPKR